MGQGKLVERKSGFSFSLIRLLDASFVREYPMSVVRKFISSRLVKETLAGTVAQLICYVAAIALLGLGIWLLPGLVETRTDFVFGILLLTTVSLLLATLGSLSGLAESIARGKIEPPR
jgi:hypothetical protein